MKMFKTEDFLKMKNPTPGEIYRSELLTSDDQANDLGAMFGIAPPKFEGPLHYHEKRESIIIILSGEGLEIYEDERVPIKAGDVIPIPPGIKHTMVNMSDNELRYIEFYTFPPAPADFHFVE